MAARLVAEREAAEATGAAPTDEARQARAAAAKSWLGTLTLPAAVRTPLARCMESSAKGSLSAVAREVAALHSACASYLDPGSRAELDALVHGLGSDGRAVLPARAGEP